MSDEQIETKNISNDKYFLKIRTNQNAKYKLIPKDLEKKVHSMRRSFIYIIIQRSIHRDLKSDSHKRFCNRDFACGPYVLDHGWGVQKRLSELLPQ